MHRTKSDLPEESRRKLAALLNARLADSLDLMLRAKQAHWNVKGAQFATLHPLFDAVAESAERHADNIAERAVQLGGIAEGVLPLIQERSTLGEHTLDRFDGRDHLDALSSAVAAVGRHVRQAVDHAVAWKDLATADLLTEIVRDLDKTLWMLEAHLQGRWSA
jgi:starvation-inducible DNA-binding protein